MSMKPSQRSAKLAADWRAFTARHGNIKLSQGLPGAEGKGSGGGSKKAPAKGPSVLSRVIDFVSRPLYGSTNVASNVLDQMASDGKNQVRNIQSGKGFNYSDAAKTLAKTLPVANVGTYIEGMTEKDDKKKKLGVDLIDQTGEMLKEVKGEKYEKPTFEESPGATIARGVGGFALDVALDPITYIPIGGLAASVGKNALRLGRGAKGAKVAVEAVEEGVKKGAKAPKKPSTEIELFTRGKADAPAARQVNQARSAAPVRYVDASSGAGAAARQAEAVPVLKLRPRTVEQAARLANVSKGMKGSGAILRALTESAKKASAAPVENVAEFARKYQASGAPGADNLSFKFGNAPVPGEHVVKALDEVGRLGKNADPVSVALVQKFKESPAGERFVSALKEADQVMPGEPRDALHAIRTFMSNPQSKQHLMLRAGLGDDTMEAVSKLPTREQGTVLEALSRVVDGNRGISPQELREFPDVVRTFMREKLAVTPEDFDAVVRNAPAARAANPPANVLADGTPITHEAREFASSLDMTVGELFNQSKDVLKQIARDSFNGKVGATKGYKILDGQLNQYAAMRVFRNNVKKTQKDLQAKLGRKPYHSELVSAYRYGADGIPSIARTFERYEKIASDSGKFLGIRVDGKEIPFLPSSLYSRAENVLDSSVIDRILYNPSTSARFTELFTAMGQAMRGAPDETLLATLRRTKSANGRPFHNPLVAGGRHGFTPLRKGEKVPNSPVKGISYELAKSGKGYYTRYSGEHLTQETLAAIRALTPEMQEVSKLYSATHVLKSRQDAGELLLQAEKKLADALDQGQGTAINTLADTVEDLSVAAMENGASRLAMEITTKNMSEKMPRGIVPLAERVAKARQGLLNDAKKRLDPETIMDRARLRDTSNIQAWQNVVRDSDALIRDVVEEVGEAAAKAQYGVGEAVELAALRSQVGAARMIDWFGDMFNVRSRTTVDGVQIYEAFRQGVSVHGKDINVVQKAIYDVSKRFNVRIGDTKETALSTAFKLLQRGEDALEEVVRVGGKDAELIAAAAEGLRPILKKFFDLENAGISGDFFWRNSQNHKYIHEAWNYHKMGRFSKEPFKEAFVKGNPAEAWRKWDIDNPGEFLNLYNLVAHRALGAKLIAQSLDRTMLSGGLASVKPRPGFMRPKQEGRSYLFAGLEESQLYYDRRALDAISEIEKRYFKTRAFDSKFMNEALDPALRAWKTGVTIYRVGHHVRNVVSNGGLSLLAEGPRNLAKSGVIAAKLLGKRKGVKTAQSGKLPVSDVEDLLSGNRLSLSNSDEIAFSVTARGGKKIEVPYTEINDELTRRGIMRTFQQAEDIIQEATGVGNTVADKLLLTHTKFGKAVGNFSEALDHHGIAQQAIQFAMNNMSKVGTKKFPTRAAVWDKAAERAYRFHPDASSLTPFEAKYMRRLIPFYTWFRGTLPAIIEASAHHPGRAVLFHKASFAAAQAQGIDAQSYANPFPEGEYIPDFLKERVLGANFKNPLNGQMFAMNPGFAHTDLASDFLGGAPDIYEDGTQQNAVSTLIGNAVRFAKSSTTPFLALPYEALTGKEFDTGDEISDMSERVDSYIPNAEFLSKLTGNSLTGSLVKGAADPRSQVVEGYQTPLFDEEGRFSPGATQGTALFNWLSGQAAVKVGKGRPKKGTAEEFLEFLENQEK